jgi:hypothetical protein
MNRLVTLCSASLLLSVVACANDDLSSQSQDVRDPYDLSGKPEPKLNLAKDAARSGGNAGASPLMTLHGGNVLVQNDTYAIFWGAQWSTASFAGDKITGLDAFFDGFGGSNFAGTATEYSGTNGQYVTTASTYMGHSIDSVHAVPRKAITTSQAVAEVCAETNNAPDANGVYFLYTATGAGHVNYCAWHSWGTCSNGAPVQVAYMPNIDGVAGCNPDDTTTGHSEGLAAVANVTSHELQESITDPRGTGWFDSSGGENGDKCAWTFSGFVTLGNGSVWKLQQEWSNEAYTEGTGSPRGCIQGN